MTYCPGEIDPYLRRDNIIKNAFSILDGSRYSIMRKVTLVVSVDSPDEVAAAEAWFGRWRDLLTYVSQNQGCGCCVDIWEVEGPDEAITDLPPLIGGVTGKMEEHMLPQELLEELERRVAEADAKPGEGTAWAVVRDEARARHSQARP